MKKIGILLFLFVFSFFLFSPCLAQSSKDTEGGGPDSGVTGEFPNPLGEGVTESPELLIKRIINGILGVVGSLALLMFIYGGLVWMTAAGNNERVEKGKNILIWATIGLVVIFASYAIVSFIIESLTGGG